MNVLETSRLGTIRAQERSPETEEQLGVGKIGNTTRTRVLQAECRRIPGTSESRHVVNERLRDGKYKQRHSVRDELRNGSAESKSASQRSHHTESLEIERREMSAEIAILETQQAEIAETRDRLTTIIAKVEHCDNTLVPSGKTRRSSHSRVVDETPSEDEPENQSDDDSVDENPLLLRNRKRGQTSSKLAAEVKRRKHAEPQATIHPQSVMVASIEDLRNGKYPNSFPLHDKLQKQIAEWDKRNPKWFKMEPAEHCLAVRLNKNQARIKWVPEKEHACPPCVKSQRLCCVISKFRILTLKPVDRTGRYGPEDVEFWVKKR